MSTLQTIASSDTLNPTSLSKINANFSTLNTDKLEASDIAGKQDTLVSGTNIKTINSISVLGSGNLSIPALTDGDKGDMTLSGSGTVWTIDNNVVTNAKLSTVATATIKGRTTAGTGNVEDLTPSQVAGMLPVATTSVAGTMSASDKSKLDSFDSWNLLINTSFTAGTPYNTGTLTTYDEYKIVVNGVSTAAVTVDARFNSNSGFNYHYLTQNTSGTQNASTGQQSIKFLYSTSIGSGYLVYGEYFLDRARAQIRGTASVPKTSTANSEYLLNCMADTGAVTSFQMSTLVGLSGTIKIYGRNY